MNIELKISNKDERANVSVRAIRVGHWEAIKKLAAVREELVKDTLEYLIEKELGCESAGDGGNS